MGPRTWSYFSKIWTRPQSRQSAKLFLQSSELGLPHPLTRRRVCPPYPSVHTRSQERGMGESQFRRGDIHCGTLGIYVCTLWTRPTSDLPRSSLFRSWCSRWGSCAAAPSSTTTCPAWPLPWSWPAARCPPNRSSSSWHATCPYPPPRATFSTRISLLP